ncbi:MAG: type II toxin-antitoxin system RelE/ParE family toxin [Oscillospiraceae bacterium]|nr:type II toxin-antitoxin system RelE/ParE family toxin [Oscillospiraceae bacterium]
MNFQVVFMKDAQRDLGVIEEYLSQFYANTARKFFTKLQDMVLKLESMPYLYPAYDADRFFRRMVVGDYLLFYSVEEERNLVIVHRIFHAARNISQQILIRRSYPDE